MSGPSARRWCFTINNPTDDHEQSLGEAGEHERVLYLVFGRETAESGTPHFQGFVVFRQQTRRNKVKSILGGNPHLEVTRGTSSQAADYCKKDGEFEEFGQLPSSEQGKRNDINEFVDWVKTVDPLPSLDDIAVRFPSLWLKYHNRLSELLYILRPPSGLVPESAEPRPGWQRELSERLTLDPDDRHIEFIIDETGKTGKSWMTRYYMTHYPDKVQVLRVGKRDDLALAIDPSKSIFFFDIPRGNMSFLQYSILESLKDRIVFSPKFHSTSKIMRHYSHVIVFGNEPPDISALSEDRYKIITI